MKKSCDTCRYSYYEKDTSRHPTIGILRQHCSSGEYNSPTYTEEMLIEDMKNGCCRFWAADDEKMKTSA